MKTPFPHQDAGANWLTEKSVGYLAWGPRTGKTLTACLAAIRAGAKRILVVCPKSVIPVWVDELTELGIEVGGYSGTAKQKRLALEKPSLVINYESIWRKPINPASYDVAIYDEAHRLSNLRTKLVEKLSVRPKAKKSWLLSGTPMIESELQLAGQMFCARGSFYGFSNPYDYMWKYWRWNEYSYKMEVLDHRHAREIREKFSAWASNETAENLGMPEKLYELIRVNPSKADIARIEQNRNSVKANMFGEISPTTLALREQQACGGWNEVLGVMEPSAKLDAAVQLVQDQLDCGEQVLITCRFVEEAEYIAKVLHARCITGDTPLPVREHIRVEFQAGNVQVVVAQVQTVKVGLDFSAASVHIFFSNDHSGETRAQAEDRTRNLTKTEPSRIIDICVTELELAIRKSVKNKLDFNARLLKKPLS